MKTVNWLKFTRQNPIRLMNSMGVTKMKVTYGKYGGYFNVYYHPAWDDDLGYEHGDGFVTEKKTGKKTLLCDICKRIHRVRFIVPYDGSRPPGHFCYWCRRKYSIMDVKDAKRYHKVL